VESSAEQDRAADATLDKNDIANLASFATAMPYIPSAGAKDLLRAVIDFALNTNPAQLPSA